MCKCRQLPVWLLLEQRCVQITSGSPFAVGEAFQAGGCQHESRLSVGESVDHAGAPPNLPVESLNRVVRVDAPPVFARLNLNASLSAL